MGTRGFRVYRYKGFYFIYYNHNDSSPDILGLDVMFQVPVGDEGTYEQWLTKLRAKFQALLDKNPSGLNGEKFSIAKLPPRNDVFTEWIYTIDLDHEVFLIDNHPVFSLKNRPTSARLFLAAIGFDSYGHRAHSRLVPQQHVYTKPTPPAIEDERVAKAPDYKEVSIEELLGVVDNIPDFEGMRIMLYELIVSGHMQSHDFGFHFALFEAEFDPTAISSFMRRWGEQVLRLGLSRMCFGTDPKIVVETTADSDENDRLVWLAPNICVRFATNLGDERYKKTQLADFVDALNARTNAANQDYGVLFSFYHCVVVKLDADNTVTTTPALQFLPDLFATSPSTPGIAAIARLGFHKVVMAPATPRGPPLDADHFLHKIPLDVLQTIALVLPPKDLDSLCAASSVFHPASTHVLRFPHVDEMRLVRGKYSKYTPPKPLNIDFSAPEDEYLDDDCFDQRWDRGNIRALRILYRGEFTVAANGDILDKDNVVIVSARGGGRAVDMALTLGNPIPAVPASFAFGDIGSKSLKAVSYGEVVVDGEWR